MTPKQEIRNKLKLGWYFKETKYNKPKVTTYTLEKRISNRETETSYIIGSSSLKFFPEAKILKANETTVALNFTPCVPKRNHAITISYRI